MSYDFPNSNHGSAGGDSLLGSLLRRQRQLGGVAETQFPNASGRPQRGFNDGAPGVRIAAASGPVDDKLQR